MPGSDAAGSNAGSVAESGTGTRASTVPVADGSGSNNQEDTEIRDAVDQPGGAASANNSDTAMNEAMHKLTLDGEPIEAKRKFFKSFQSLITDKSGLHVWKSAKIHPNLDLDTITSAERPTKEFITQHKHRYKSMRWIAISVDDAITSGTGQHPRISVMVKWL